MSDIDKKRVELDEGERELLHNALEILSPDDPDQSELLEILTQTALDATIEPGALEMDFSKEEIELCIAALDVINPDDFEMQELGEKMAERFRELHRDFDEAPGF